jgi:hypothetical protein
MIYRVQDGDFRVVWTTQFEQRMRTLCTNEVWGVKMKKNEKIHVLQFEKIYFLKCFFLAAPLALDFQYDL